MSDAHVAAILDRFVSLRVLVLGDALLDSYISGRVERVCREAPVPLLAVEQRVDVPGGAGNTAANAAALGARVRLLTALGDDDGGRRLHGALRRSGVDVEAAVVEEGRRTSVKHRLLAGSQLLLRFDEDAGPHPGASVAEVCRRFAAFAADADAVVVSDYAQGLAGEALGNALAELRRSRPALPFVVDSRRPQAFRGAGVSVAKLNRQEAEGLLSLPPGDGDLDALRHRAGEVRELVDARAVLLSMDTDGVLLATADGAVHHVAAATAPATGHTTGAGDTLVAALALALAAGAGEQEAARIGTAASGLVVHRDGTTVCGLEDLRASLSPGATVMRDLDALRLRAEALRRRGGRVVFTNGCFDILHLGHVVHLDQARQLGDLLVVAVNDDAGVRRLKGAARPVNPLDDRIGVLAGLSSVDVIVPFTEERPLDAIRAVRPEVYVKGGDWSRAPRTPEMALVEQLGGRVILLDDVEARSTTRVIERIRGEPGAVERVPEGGRAARSPS